MTFAGNMAYRVELAERAVRDLRLIFLAIHADESLAAEKWFIEMERAIDSLRDSPNRCPVAPESGRRQTIRHLLYGRRPHVYRILFRVVPKDRTVFVLHIRHAARRPAS